MPSPQNLFGHWTRRRVSARRTPTRIPSAPPSTEAIFLIMRRLRVPLIGVITTFSVSG